MALTSPSSHKLTTTVRLPRVFDTYIYKTVLYYATHTQHRWPLTVHCPCLALRLAWKNHSWLGEKGLLAFYPRFGRKIPSLCWSGDVGETRLLPIYYYYCGTKPTAAVARNRETPLGVRPRSLPTTSPVHPCGPAVAGLAWPGPPTLSGFLRLLLDINHQSALRASYPGLSGLVHFPSHPDPCH